MQSPWSVVREVIGVYDADGSLRGEVAYALRKVSGTAHCALCDITHAGLRRRPGFDEMRERLGVPLTLLHRDERPPDVLAVTGDRTPVVVVRTDGGLEPLLDAADLARCGPSPEALFQAIDLAMAAAGLRVEAS